MSHDATNWAIKQRGLKPATKIVLWHLADCHNGHTGQCNPKQTTLAYLCEMSRASVNRHLKELEKRGLIIRRQTYDPIKKERSATHYKLAMDQKFTTSQNETKPQDSGLISQDPQDVEGLSPNLRQSPMSQKSPPLCLKKAKTNVSNFDKYNPGIEPGIEPLPAQGSDLSNFEKTDMPPRDQHVTALLDGFLSRRTKPPRLRASEGAATSEHAALCRILLRHAPKDTSEIPDWWDKMEAAIGIASAVYWPTEADVERASKSSQHIKKTGVEGRSLPTAVQAIREGKTYLCTNVSAATAREYISKGWVTEAQCKAAQIIF